MNENLLAIYKELGGDAAFGSVEAFAKGLEDPSNLDAVYKELGGDSSFGNIDDFISGIGFSSPQQQEVETDITAVDNSFEARLKKKTLENQRTTVDTDEFYQSDITGNPFADSQLRSWQLMGEAVANAAVGAVGTTLGAIGGAVYGFQEMLGAVPDDGKNSMLNNPITTMRDYLKSEINTNFTPSEDAPESVESWGDFVQMIEQPEFWLNEGRQGISSMMEFLIPGAAVGKMSKGLNFGTKVIGKGQGATGFVGKTLQLGRNATVELVDAVPGSLVMSYLEGAVEASAIHDEIEREAFVKYQQEGHNQEDALALARQDAANAASETARANMAVLVPTNALELNAVLNKPGGSGIRKLAGFLGSVAMGILSEATQEGLQFGIGEYEKAKYVHDLYSEHGDNNYEFSGAISEIVKAHEEGNPELYTSIFLGGLLGGGAASVGQIGSLFSSPPSKLAKKPSDLFKKTLTGKIKYDANNQPQIDPKKMKAHLKGVADFSMINQFKTLAEDNGNEHLFDFFETEQLAAMAFSALEDGSTVDEISEFIAGEFNKDYKDIFGNTKSSDTVTGKLTKIGEAYKEVNVMTKKKGLTPIQRKLYYDYSIREQFVLDKIKEIEDTQASLKDSEKTTDKARLTGLDSQLEELQALKTNYSKILTGLTSAKLTNELKKEEVKEEVKEVLDSGVPEEIVAQEVEDEGLVKEAKAEMIAERKEELFNEPIHDAVDVQRLKNKYKESGIENYESIINDKANAEYKRQKQEAGEDFDPATRYSGRNLLKSVEEEKVDNAFRNSEYNQKVLASGEAMEEFLANDYASKLSNPLYENDYKLYHGLKKTPVLDESESTSGESTDEVPVESVEIESVGELSDLVENARPKEKREAIDVFTTPPGGVLVPTISPESHGFIPEAELAEYEAGVEAVLKGEVNVGDSIELRVNPARQLAKLNTADNFIIDVLITDKQGNQRLVGQLPSSKKAPYLKSVREKMFYDFQNGEPTTYTARVTNIPARYNEGPATQQRRLDNVQGFDLNTAKFIIATGTAAEPSYQGLNTLDGNYTLPDVAVKTGFVYLMIKDPGGRYNPHRIFTQKFSESPQMKEEALAAIELANRKDSNGITGNERLKAIVRFEQPGDYGPPRIVYNEDGSYTIMQPEKGETGVEETPIRLIDAQEVYNYLGIDNKPIHFPMEGFNAPTRAHKQHVVANTTSQLNDMINESFYIKPSLALDNVQREATVEEALTETEIKTSRKKKRVKRKIEPNTKFSKGPKMKLPRENDKAARKWFHARFPEVPFEISDEQIDKLYDIYNTGGANIWGVFKNAAVILAENRPEGTTRHEAFHVAFNLFATDAQRKQLLLEMYDRAPKSYNFSREELIADIDSGSSQVLEKFSRHIGAFKEEKQFHTRLNNTLDRIGNITKRINKLFSNMSEVRAVTQKTLPTPVAFTDSYKKKQNIYDAKLTSAAFAKIRKKFLKNPIPISSPIKIDGSPAVLDFLEEVRGSILTFGNIKSVSAEEFISYATEYLNNYSPYAVSFKEKLGFENYGISSAFTQWDNDGTFTHDYAFENITINQREIDGDITPERAAQLRQELSLDRITEIKNNKIGLFYDNQNISGNSHFRSNPYAWGTLVYFWNDRVSAMNKTPNSALIHEIQNDFYERLKKGAKGTLKNIIDVLIQKKELPAIFRNFNFNATDLNQEFKNRLDEFIALGRIEDNSELPAFILSSRDLNAAPTNITNFYDKQRERLSELAKRSFVITRILENVQYTSTEEIKNKYILKDGNTPSAENIKSIKEAIEALAPLLHRARMEGDQEMIQVLLKDRDELRSRLERGPAQLSYLNVRKLIKDKTNITEGEFRLSRLPQKILLVDEYFNVKKNKKVQIQSLDQRIMLTKVRLNKTANISNEAIKDETQGIFAKIQNFKTYFVLNSLSSEERLDILTFLKTELNSAVKQLGGKVHNLDKIEKNKLKNYSKHIIHHLIQKVIREKGKDYPIYFAGAQATNTLQVGSPGGIYAGPEEVLRGFADKVGRMYKDMASIPGVKLSYVEKIPGMRAGGYKVDISGYETKGIPLFSREQEGKKSSDLATSPATIVEERMAELFEEIKNDEVIPKTKVEKFLKKLKDFLMDVFNIAKSYITQETSIDRFMREIDRNTLGRNLLGQRRKSYEKIFNRNVAKFKEARFKADNFTSFEAKQAIRLTNKEILNIILEEDIMTGEFAGLPAAKSIKEFVDNPEVVKYFKDRYKGTPQVNTMLGIYEVAIDVLEEYKEDTGLDEEYDKIITAIREGIDIIGKFSEGEYTTPEQYNKAGLVHDLLLDLNYSQGVTIKISETITTQLQSESDLEYDNETNILEGWQTDYVKTSPMESISAKFRWILGSIPLKNDEGIEQKDNLGALRYLNSAVVFNSLINNINDSTSVEEMMTKLDALEAYQPWVSDFKAKLDADLISELFARVGRTITPNFKVVDYDTQTRATRVFSSNRKGVASLLLADFRSDFENLFKTKEGYSIPESVTAPLEKLNEKIQSTDLSNDILDRILEIFNKAGLRVNSHTIQAISEGSHDGQRRVNGKVAIQHIAQDLLKIIQAANEGRNPFAQLGGELTSAKRIANYMRSSDLNLSLLSFLNVEGEKIYNNIQGSWMWKQVHDVRKGFVDYSDSVFHRMAPIYDWFKNFGTSIELAPLDGYKIDAQGKKYTDFSPQDQHALNINTWLDGLKNKDGLTFYRVGTLSDAGVSYFMKLPWFKRIRGVTGQAGVVDYLFDVVNQEYDRIKTLSNADPSFSVKNYLEWTVDEEGNPVINKEKSNGLRFHYFPYLNNNLPVKENGALDEVRIKELIDSNLNRSFTNFVKELQKNNLVYKNEAGWQSLEGLDERVDGIQLHKEQLTNTMLGSLKLYFYNQFLINTQTNTLFSDDPAFYKENATDRYTSIDYQKRNKQVHAPGIFGNFERPEYNVLYINDIELPSDLVSINEEGKINYEESIVYNFFINQGVSKTQAKSIADLYKSNNITDAGAYHTLDRRKEVETSYGRWTPTMETAYNKIKEGKGTLSDELQFFGPLKPHVFTKKKVSTGAGVVVVPIQHKNAEFTLTPALATASKELTTLLSMMEDNMIDVAMFDSAIKAGLMNALDWGGTVAPHNIHTLPNSDWKIQNEVPSHLLDTSNLFGTQIRKHIMANLELNKEYDVEGTKMMGSQVFNLFQDLLSQNILEDLARINKKLGANSELKFSKLRSNLLAEIDSRGLGDQYRQALDVVHNAVSNGVDFAIPLWHPSLAKLQPVLNSFYKGVTKQKFPGGSMVNMPGFGFEEELSIVWKGNEKDGTLSIDYVEVAAPSSYSILTEKYGDENGVIDINKLPKEFRKALQGVVYRIPTEDKYSMFPIKITKFLPQDASGVIVMPREATTIAGLDFDVDKVFAMLYHMDKHGVIGSTGPSRKNRDNKILDIIRSVLRSPYHTAEFLNPGGFERLKAIRDAIIPNFTQNEDNNLALPQTQIRLSDRNLVGGKMIGIFANDNAFHSLALYTDLGTDGLKFNGKTDKDSDFDIYSVTQQFDENGVTVSRNFAELLAASVDNAKDPVLGDLNINAFTVNVLSFILHHGYSLETGLYFINQPAIRTLSKDHDLALSKGLTTYDFLNQHKKTAKTVVDYNEARNTNFKLSFLKKFLQEDSVGGMRDDYRETNAWRLISKFIDIHEKSKDLGDVVQAVRFDSGNTGPTMIDVDVALTTIRSLHRNPDLNVTNLGQILPKIDDSLNMVGNSEVQSVDAFLQVILDEIKYAKEFFPYFKESFMNIKTELLNILPRHKQTLTAKELKLVNDHIIGAMASINFSVPEEYNSYEEFLRKFPSDFKENSTKVSQGRFSDFLNLFDEVTVKRTDIPILKLKRGLGINTEDIDLIKAQFEEFLIQEPKLANDLITYSFLTNGFAFNQNSFSHLIPTDYYKANRHIIETVDHNAENLPMLGIESIVLNIIKNNYRALLPKIDSQNYERMGKNGYLIVDGPVNVKKEPVEYVTIIEETEEGELDYKLATYIGDGVNGTIESYYMVIPPVGVASTFTEFVNQSALEVNNIEYTDGEIESMKTSSISRSSELKIKHCG